MSDNGNGSAGKVKIELVPLGAVLEVDRGTALENVLMTRGMEFPCGGLGTCGGCRVQILEGEIEARRRKTRPPCRRKNCLTAGGWLVCVRADSSLKLKVEQWTMPVLTDDTQLARTRRKGLVVAIDLGTTTIVAQLLDLATGKLLGLRTGLNPQTIQGADVMSRVRFAMDSTELTTLIREFLGTYGARRRGRARRRNRRSRFGRQHGHASSVLRTRCRAAHARPVRLAESGGTAISPRRIWAGESPSSAVIRFLPCIGGFVGSDILAGILAVGLHTGSDLRALIDLGTNGEISLGNRDKILCASTAAGSAFEAGSIKMGMRAATGAISRVFL